MRLFLALWPSEQALRRIEEIQDVLRDTATRQGVRFTRPERIHLTLHFYGDVSEASLPALTERLSSIQSPAINVSTTTLGGFPTLFRPRIAWLGLQGDGLADLQSAAVRAVEGLVAPMEETFAAHLTLARINPGSKEVGRLIHSIPKEKIEPPASWTAERISIVQTLPNSAYEDVWSHRFTPPV